MSRLPRIDPRDLRDHADPDRIERVWRKVARDLPQNAVASRPVRAAGVGGRFGGRAILWAACLAGVFGAGLFAGSVRLSTSTSDDTGAEPLDAQLTDVFAAGTRQRTFPLPGGGRLVLQPESLMEVVEVRDGNVRLHLLRGRASVDASTSDMSFAIVAGEALTLAPAGSVVSFSRLDTDVDVAVDRGSVEVVSPTGRQVVRKGERSRVPIVAAVTSNDPTPSHQVVANTPPHNNDHNDADRASKDPVATTPDGEVAVITPAPAPAPPSWMVLYTQDKLEEAGRILEERGGIASAITSSQSASEIMALGDIAQVSKKFDLWIRSRRRVADEFPSDPNASAAATELAPVLERMGQTELAAKYRALALQSRLSETTLCNQLDNAPKDTAEARRKAAAIAADYLARFPEGTCAEDAKGVIEDSKGDPPEPSKEPKKADPKKDEPKKPEDAKKPEEGKKADEPKKDAPEGSSPP